MQSFHVRDKSISIYRFLSASSRVRSGSACHHRSSADTSPEATSGASGLNTIPPIPKLPAPASAPRLPGRLPFSVTHTPAKRPLSTNPNWETGSRRGTPAGSQRRAGGRAAARTVARAGRGGACALRVARWGAGAGCSLDAVPLCSVPLCTTSSSGAFSSVRAGCGQFVRGLLVPFAFFSPLGLFYTK